MDGFKISVVFEEFEAVRAQLNEIESQLDRILLKQKALGSGTLVKTCEECGHPFLADSDKRKFCPPTEPGGVSACMNRAKQRRFQNKAKL